MKNLAMKTICAALALAMCFGLAACGGSPAPADTTPAPSSGQTGTPSDGSASSGEEYPEMTIVIADYNVANSGPAIGTQRAVDYIEEKSGGRIRCETYIGGTLMEATDTVSGLADGVADISYYMVGLVSGIQPVGELLTQQFYREFPDMLGNTEIIREAFATIPEFQDELISQGVYCIDAVSSPESYIVFRDNTANSINSAGDLKGKILMETSTYVIQSWQGIGVSAMAMGPADWYSNFERGVCDALNLNLPCYNDFGITELIGSYLTFGDNELGKSAGASSYLVNYEKWSSWPENVQKLVTEAFNNACDYMVQRDYEVETQYKTDHWTAENTHNIPSSDMQSFYEVSLGSISLWKDAVNAKGYDADAIFNAYDAIVASHTS